MERKKHARESQSPKNTSTSATVEQSESTLAPILTDTPIEYTTSTGNQTIIKRYKSDAELSIQQQLPYPTHTGRSVSLSIPRPPNTAVHSRSRARSTSSSMMPSGRTASTGNQRQRSAIACQYCRRRKIRCSGFDPSVENSKCSNCIRYNQQCLFTPVSSAAMHTLAIPTSIPPLQHTQPYPYQYGAPPPTFQQVNYSSSSSSSSSSSQQLPPPQQQPYYTLPPPPTPQDPYYNYPQQTRRSSAIPYEIPPETALPPVQHLPIQSMSYTSPIYSQSHSTHQQQLPPPPLPPPPLPPPTIQQQQTPQPPQPILLGQQQTQVQGQTPVQYSTPSQSVTPQDNSKPPTEQEQPVSQSGSSSRRGKRSGRVQISDLVE